jgi:hypothetical protein
MWYGCFWGKELLLCSNEMFRDLRLRTEFWWAPVLHSSTHAELCKRRERFDGASPTIFLFGLFLKKIKKWTSSKLIFKSVLFVSLIVTTHKSCHVHWCDLRIGTCPLCQGLCYSDWVTLCQYDLRRNHVSLAWLSDRIG